MKKLYASLLLLALMVVGASAPATAHVDNANASNIDIGSTVSDFKLPDANGKEHSLASLRGKNGTVFIFISVQCPVSNAYNKRMAQLAEQYKARGVNVVGINSNVAETPEAIKQHAAENGLNFTILKDKSNKIADVLGARVTPEAYYLDASNKLVYRGRIDDADPRRGSEPTSEDLRNAIDATLNGKPVEKAQALAFGCSIKRG
ncbi:MAG TPA: thioredoxin family protein [Pyrinomonadaceae bacterium]|jgi:peroxiredoxin